MEIVDMILAIRQGDIVWVRRLLTRLAWDIVPGVSLRTCGAAHLVIYKLVAGRTHDLSDIESIVRRQGDALDVDCIRRWGREFAELKGDPDLLRPFEDALRKRPLFEGRPARMGNCVAAGPPVQTKPPDA
jgi:hypothetical protein